MLVAREETSRGDQEVVSEPGVMRERKKSLTERANIEHRVLRGYATL
jgi:hypothetical protein